MAENTIMFPGVNAEEEKKTYTVDDLVPFNLEWDEDRSNDRIVNPYNELFFIDKYFAYLEKNDFMQHYFAEENCEIQNMRRENDTKKLKYIQEYGAIDAIPNELVAEHYKKAQEIVDRQNALSNLMTQVYNVFEKALINTLTGYFESILGDNACNIISNMYKLIFKDYTSFYINRYAKIGQIIAPLNPDMYTFTFILTEALEHIASVNNPEKHIAVMGYDFDENGYYYNYKGITYHLTYPYHMEVDPRVKEVYGDEAKPHKVFDRTKLQYEAFDNANGTLIGCGIIDAIQKDYVNCESIMIGSVRPIEFMLDDTCTHVIFVQELESPEEDSDIIFGE